MEERHEAKASQSQAEASRGSPSSRAVGPESELGDLQTQTWPLALGATPTTRSRSHALPQRQVHHLPWQTPAGQAPPSRRHCLSQTPQLSAAAHQDRLEQQQHTLTLQACSKPTRAKTVAAALSPSCLMDRQHQRLLWEGHPQPPGQARHWQLQLWYHTGCVWCLEHPCWPEPPCFYSHPFYRTHFYPQEHRAHRG